MLLATVSSLILHGFAAMVGLLAMSVLPGSSLLGTEVVLTRELIRLLRGQMFVNLVSRIAWNYYGLIQIISLFTAILDGFKILSRYG